MKERFLNELPPRFGSADTVTCADGAISLRLSDAENGDFSELSETLPSSGWELVSERKGDKTLFRIYEREKGRLYTSFTEAERCIRLLLDADAPRLPYDADFEAVTMPLVTQVRPLYYGVDCGMSYVIRLSDGRFVLIDGGVGEHGETEHLYNIIIRQNVRAEKPRIAAWFVTHAHSDHFGCPTKFLGRYGEEVILERLIYNWPVRELCNMGHDVAPFDELAASLPKGAVITPHAGDVYRFADATFEILYACEDLYPDFIKNFNDTSTIMRMTLGEHRVLWLGDAMKLSSNTVADRYSPAELSSDILQVGHHGYSGGSDRLNRAADPTLLLWPCPDFWFHVVRLWPSNQYLISSEKIFATYVSGIEETTLDLSVSELSSGGVVNVRDGALPYREDFSHGAVRRLHWTCITGGSTGYRPARISIEDGKCRLETGEAYTVCEIRQPWQMENTDGFTMTLRGRVESLGEIRMFCDYASPTVFSEEKAIGLPLPESGDFVLTVSASAKDGRVRTFLDGREEGEAPYAPEERNGLYLIMKNSVITLDEVSVEPADGSLYTETACDLDKKIRERN